MRTRQQMMRSAAITRVLDRSMDRAAIGSLNDLRQAYENELAAHGPEIAAETDKLLAKIREVDLRLIRTRLRCAVCDKARRRKTYLAPLLLRPMPTASSPPPRMIRISITAAAFDAIAATLPVGSVAFAPDAGDKGERHIWLEPLVVNKLRALRGPGETYSDVILRLAEGVEQN